MARRVTALNPRCIASIGVSAALTTEALPLIPQAQGTHRCQVDGPFRVEARKQDDHALEGSPGQGGQGCNPQEAPMESSPGSGDQRQCGNKSHPKGCCFASHGF